MLKLEGKAIKKVMYGNAIVKSVYYREQKVYPNITGENTGLETTEWVYDLPKRTRTTTPWRQDIYGDGTLGEKEYGTPQTEIETGEILTQEYIYSYLNQNRRWTSIYEFPDGDIYEDYGNVETGKVHLNFYTIFVNEICDIPARGGTIQIQDTANGILI